MKKNGSAPRQSSIHRATKETDILVEWTLDGSGQGKIDTGIRFFDHMLELLSKHGFFDLTVRAKGDIDIDEHHTVEDVGHRHGQGPASGLGREGRDQAIRICLSSARRNAGASHGGSQRPALPRLQRELPDRKIKAFDLGLFEDFFQAFVTHGGLNLHVNLMYGRNPHHIMEAIFKATSQGPRSGHDVGRTIGG